MSRWYAHEYKPLLRSTVRHTSLHPPLIDVYIVASMIEASMACRCPLVNNGSRSNTAKQGRVDWQQQGTGETICHFFFQRDHRNLETL